MIRAVATDVDGTMTDDNSLLSVDSVAAVRKLEEANIKVMLCSGNALCVLKSLARYIGCSGPIIAENGGVVEYRGKVKILGDIEGPKKALEKLRQAHGSEVKEAWSNAYRFADLAILRTLAPEKIRPIVSEIEGIKVIDSGFAYHIIDKRVDKGAGLKVAADWIGIKPEELAGIGDSMTDIELLRYAGFRGAVANAPDEVKRVANFVAAKRYGEGFAEIVDKILLLKSE
ncbi:MAG: phosphoglycolate phosphatase [Candidatus Methanomethylicia archaeon]|nr:phosphoglycolate phosphatase [Candidatus Methanomethylicia archaeon]